MEVIRQLLSNQYFVWGAMAVIIFCLTQILKLPIKAATKRLIKDEKVRGLFNLVILVIPFVLGWIAEYLFNCIYLNNDLCANTFTGLSGLQYGSSSLFIYGIFEKIAKKVGLDIKLDNPYETTDEGKAVIELVDKVQEDGKIDKSDISAVDEFWKTISKDNPKK